MAVPKVKLIACTIINVINCAIFLGTWRVVQWQKHHFKSGGAENNWGIIKKLLRKSKLRFEDAKKL